MTIPQEELNKLGETTDGLFEEHAEIEEEVEEKGEVSESTEEDSVADKARIPYSRFEKVNERAIAAEARLQLLEEQAASNKPIQTEELTPDQWLKLYGDNDDARKAWALDQELRKASEEKMEERIIRNLEERESQKQSQVQENLEYIEDSLADFQEKLGRKLSESEESALLDIQDEFTPQDDSGHYMAPLMAPEKAYEILNLRGKVSTNKTSQARRRVTSITGSSSEGDGSSKAFENYKPGVSGLWRDQL
jgi:hypothetical protein